MFRLIIINVKFIKLYAHKLIINKNDYKSINFYYN